MGPTGNMTRLLRILTPSRLHFGLLGWGPQAPRQFGGVGLMVERPGLEIVAEALVPPEMGGKRPPGGTDRST